MRRSGFWSQTGHYTRASIAARAIEVERACRGGEKDIIIQTSPDVRPDVRLEDLQSDGLDSLDGRA